MSAFLLYHRKTKPTGRKIAEALGIPHGADPAEIPADITKVIRWGNAKRIRGGIATINSGAGIMLAGDKLEALKAFQAHDVSCVEFQVDVPPYAPDHNEPMGSPVWFARKRRGFGGKDIVILSDNKVWPNNNGAGPLDDRTAAQKIAEAEFFTKWINNDKEYRIHVVNGEIVRYQRKYALNAGAGAYAAIRVQNHANGYVFKQPQRPLNADRFDAAKEAVAALGLKFGAVDLIVTPNNRQHPRGKAVVLEVNTAPSCSPMTIAAYAAALRKELANG